VTPDGLGEIYSVSSVEMQYL